MSTPDTTIAKALPFVPLLTIEARDDLVDGVLAKLAEMAPADRMAFLEGIVSTLDDMTPKGNDLLCHRARRVFWEAALDLARIDAGETAKGAAIPSGLETSRAALRRFLERKAWSAATTLPLRSFLDLLPRGLHEVADALAREVNASQDAPLSTSARVSPH